jgi:hypothetical protein
MRARNPHRKIQRTALFSAWTIALQDLTPWACVVFVGLGCYDHGHGSDSIRRQQCPDTLLAKCKAAGWGLTVLLLDGGFSETGPDQIYDIDNNWQPGPANEKVRRFNYKDKPFRLWIYAIPVPTEEYAGTAETLAGVNIKIGFGAALSKCGGCLVVGNFYDSESKPHYTAGDQTKVTQLGFKTI